MFDERALRSCGGYPHHRQFKTNLSIPRHHRIYPRPAGRLSATSFRPITHKIQSNHYRNQYAFELEVQTAIKDLHDTHVYLSGGILDQFSFLRQAFDWQSLAHQVSLLTPVNSPFRFLSLSKDGKEAPKIFIYGMHQNQLR